MRTPQERLDAMMSMLTDSDLNLTLKEGFSHIYHWYMYEMALRKRNIGQRRMKKHGTILDENVEAYRLRKYLSKV